MADSLTPIDNGPEVEMKQRKMAKKRPYRYTCFPLGENFPMASVACQGGTWVHVPRRSWKLAFFSAPGPWTRWGTSVPQTSLLSPRNKFLATPLNGVVKIVTRSSEIAASAHHTRRKYDRKSTKTLWSRQYFNTFNNRKSISLVPIMPFLRMRKEKAKRL